MKGQKHKYIFVIGGVMSGVGKGITTSSIGTILQAKGLSVNIGKVDPYLNVDAGTMNPTEHGEVFVLNSGLETDQDMGNYERFLNRDLTEGDYMTSGMVYKHVIDKERSLGFGGKCIDADNIRDEIVQRIINAGKANKSDVSIIEIGGTVGDYQNIMFIEAARVLKIRNPNDVIFIMVSYLPIPNKLGEMKSKPTQNAVRQLSSYGVQTDIVVARAEVPLDKRRKEKIAFSCSVPIENVISAPDIDSIYDVPLNFERDNIGELITKLLGLPNKKSNMSEWKSFVGKVNKARNGNGGGHGTATKSGIKKIDIAVVGKYFDTGDFVLSDAYVSVIEAIKFSSYALGLKPELHWISSKHFEGTPAQVKAAIKSKLGGMKGIIVPGGFGESGIEGKINVIEYARTHKVPYFGLCYGMQLLVIEYARHVAKIKGATTTEIDKTSFAPVIDIMESQKKLLASGQYGASMRLGAYPCVLKEGTVARAAYKKSKSKARQTIIVSERHRHRYEVNPVYVEQLKQAGLVFSGKSPDRRLMEIAELPRTGPNAHPFFLGTQFHPEFLARPLDPHPLFTEFMRVAALQ